ncbi:EthD domain-containing protein [uncultured Alsobacter sp.]|uniref:EthD domain-containing protein n=1 Tax=uncultured Alsobacter sp. TaxID=1748258 RepID=UPI0025F71C8F|nr:EthD domain-containing protein [uncultured Alsobacter sp.]
MITRIGLAPRRPGLDVDTFQAHWRGRHGELAAQLPGVRRYWQNHAVLRDGEPLLPWTGFDACAEIDFESLEAMAGAFVTPLYLGPIRDDEAYLIEKTRGGMVLTRRTILSGAPHLEGIRLLTFLRAAPGKPARDLQAALAEAPDVPEAVGRELCAALDPEEAGGHVSVFDAVEVLWFATAQDAERHVVSAGARARRAGFAERVRGVERLIARVRVMVDAAAG